MLPSPDFEDIEPPQDPQRTLPLGDTLADYRESFRGAVKRATVKELAYRLNLVPESVQNQVREWNSRKHPSADGAFRLIEIDDQHLREVAGLRGYQLVRPPKLTEPEALRIVAERAASKGFISAQEIAAVMARTKFGGGK